MYTKTRHDIRCLCGRKLGEKSGAALYILKLARKFELQIKQGPPGFLLATCTNCNTTTQIF